ncbi:DNA replication protein [gut metagenome]|uniref:DNA replication protein n=1 Tax=gut metagenome TaxID=749906 RepID=J9FRB9_9ZZZZ
MGEKEMKEMGKLGAILREINQRGFFKSIKRFKYMPYDINTALEVIELIGKSRTPKFRIDDENRFAYEQLVRWVHGDPAMQALDPETRQPKPGNLTAGIYIAGSTGSGKSWALEIIAAYTSIDHVQIEIDGETRNLWWQNKRADTICEEYSETGSLQPYRTAQILGIQDFGSEPAESMYMGNRVNVLRQLLEYRGDRTDRLTLLTSNYSLANHTLTDIYGERVTSRLTEMCNYLEIFGTDRRKI